MNRNELRYGNLIYCPTCQNKQPFQVDFFTFENDYGTGCIENDFEGIPLTEEWLLRFGFSINRTQAYKKYNNFGDQVTINKIGEEFELVYLATPIKYVHQLQNLYFALTGEELTIKNVTK